MANNIDREDLDVLISYLQQDEPRLTHGPIVKDFEKAWADWIGVDHTVMVNSGSSANDLTMMAIARQMGPGEVILSPLTWVSDVSSVLYSGMQPRFVDIDPQTLGVATKQTIDAIGSETRAIFPTHVLGLNALTHELIGSANDAGIPIVEDVCESHGAEMDGRRLGAIGFASNFSFYYAHHLSTIEGGAICTNDEEFADTIRMMRSHGLVRESRLSTKRDRYVTDHPDLNPDFIFAFPARNYRPTELNAVIGLSQIERLESTVRIRRDNFRRFLQQLDERKFRTNFETDQSSNYALILVLQEADLQLRDRVENVLRAHQIEFRRGLSGGGNQIRQPYVRQLLPDLDPRHFPNVEHVHHFGWYVGNYPSLSEQKIDDLCTIVNGC